MKICVSFSFFRLWIFLGSAFPFIINLLLLTKKVVEYAVINFNNLMEHYENQRLWAKRYSRQILVPQFAGVNGQKNVCDSSVIVVGAGGIGSTVILYLAGSGVGRLGIVDFDKVEESNLHRQIIHGTSGSESMLLKAESARDRALELNPHIKYSVILERITMDNALSIIYDFDVVVDATDNSTARYALNKACAELHKPLVSGSAVGMEGQLTVFPSRPSGTVACYQCVYPNPPQDEACKSCANAGVVGPVPGVIGNLQAVEVLKILTHPEVLDSATGCSTDGQVSVLIGKQLYFDAAAGEFHTFNMRRRRPECPACGTTTRSSPSSGGDVTAPVATPSALSLLHSRLDSEHRISASQYHRQVLSSGQPHLLLDVRSALQFDMISLKHVLGGRDGGERGQRILNFPFEEMAGDLSLAKTRIRAAIQDLCPVADSSSRGVDIYTLCRRGNDSVRAALCLLDACKEGEAEEKDSLLSDCRFFNIDGGLHAWHNEVDADFPAY